MPSVFHVQREERLTDQKSTNGWMRMGMPGWNEKVWKPFTKTHVGLLLLLLDVCKGHMVPSVQQQLGAICAFIPGGYTGKL